MFQLEIIRHVVDARAQVRDFFRGHAQDLREFVDAALHAVAKPVMVTSGAASCMARQSMAMGLV